MSLIERHDSVAQDRRSQLLGLCPMFGKPRTPMKSLQQCGLMTSSTPTLRWQKIREMISRSRGRDERYRKLEKYLHQKILTGMRHALRFRQKNQNMERRHSCEARKITQPSCEARETMCRTEMELQTAHRRSSRLVGLCVKKSN